jgi:U3 small nucleolar RNA-associated protein 4
LYLEVSRTPTHHSARFNCSQQTGIDTQPIVVPLSKFGQELSRGLPALPSTPPLVSAPDARLLVSWWNAEVRIWRVKPNDDGTEKPKVVARLALQGEENITSVSITRDGGVLAVATADVVKLFQLIRPLAGAGAGLRIRKLDMPLISGARIVRLTADGKWLGVVTASNDVKFVRIIRTDDPTDQPRPLDKIAHLQRLPREDAPFNSLTGPSGSYERSIMHAEFSTDGNVFAATDLAGYIDTWVIEGYEDPTAPEVDVEESASVMADDSDDEDDETNAQIIFLGQRWIRNPSAHLLPRLDSTPVLLSFQPTSASEQPQPNGNPAVHPTRQNPHPHSREVPSTEHRLLLTSAKHQLYLFEVMAGRLTEWSRRNPPSSYPAEYRMLDLPAKGCVWDMHDARQRIWLYGEKWLFMFDLSKDFPISESDEVSASKKRKREAIKSSSGAGDAVPSKEATVTKMRKFNGTATKDSGRTNWVDVHSPGNNAAVDDDFEDFTQPLAALRRTATQDGEASGEGKDAVALQLAEGKHDSWWHTFKYRPILGMVSISGEEGQPPEVVLVERPSWDLDLPPRFVGTHEK